MGKENLNDDEELLDDNEEKDTSGAGSETKDDKGGKGDTSKGDKTSNTKTEKTFTQAQVNKMMTTEKNQGRAAALKELGIDPKDTKAVAMVKALIDSQKTDEQKDAETKAAEQAKIAEAEQRALFAEAKAEAMTLGVKPEFVDDVVTLAMSKLKDDTDLKTIIGEFKTKYTVWFGSSDEEDKNSTGKKGTGASIKNSSKKESNKESLGARLAAQRKTTTTKKSYWSK